MVIRGRISCARQPGQMEQENGDHRPDNELERDRPRGEEQRVQYASPRGGVSENPRIVLQTGEIIEDRESTKIEIKETQEEPKAKRYDHYAGDQQHGRRHQEDGKQIAFLQ